MLLSFDPFERHRRTPCLSISVTRVAVRPIPFVSWFGKVHFIAFSLHTLNDTDRGSDTALIIAQTVDRLGSFGSRGNSSWLVHVSGNASYANCPWACYQHRARLQISQVWSWYVWLSIYRLHSWPFQIGCSIVEPRIFLNHFLTLRDL